VDDFDKIGPWSREKLVLLRNYLVAYTSILNNMRKSASNPSGWLKEMHYIDAFAGSVRPWDKESGEHIDGSPLVAIKTIPSFDRYVFIEKSKKRFCSNIKPLKTQFPEKKIEVFCGDCNDIICDDVAKRYRPRNGVRGFAFLDPYGLNLRWETVESFGKTESFDVFINFSVMGVYRQLGSRPDKMINREKINEMMGSDRWCEEVYKESRQCPLPGLAPVVERANHDLTERLASFYINQLKTCFKYVSRPIVMKGATNSPLYALILASQVPLAVSKMHEIFDRQERRKRKVVRLD